MKIKSIYIVAFILLLLCLFSFFNTFVTLENSLQDSLLQARHPVDTRIALIAIDELSLEKLGQWPWPRNIHADLINKLSAGKPAAIGIDVMFPEEGRISGEDDALVKAVQNAKNVVIPVEGFFSRYSTIGRLEPDNVKYPFPGLREAGIMGHINNFADESDGIVRKSLTFFEYKGRKINSFTMELYKLYLKNIGKPYNNIKIPVDASGQMFISFAGLPHDFDEQISYYRVLNGEIPPEYFKDKIVIIGPYTSGIAEDYYYTPLDHQDQMFGVEIHANILQDMLNGNFKQYMPDIVNILILLLFGSAAYFVFKRLSPAKSLIVMFGIIIIYFVAVKLVYNYGYIMQLLYPAALVAAIYLVMLAYRYIEEFLERKRITDVFGKYVAPQVVNQILESGEEGLKLGGTRREISVLFVDIRGFTPLSEKCQPEEVVGILNEYLNLTATSIFNNGGTLDKFIGDATMALFNAPLDLEEHAFKAVKTAWDMRQGSEELQKKLMEKFGRSAQFGIGVNTGPAVVGNIGAKFRMDYTAIGDTVNTSARLESNAKPGQILMSQSTYDLVKDRVLATSLGEIKVKGKEQGIPVYQLDGIG